MMINSTTRLGKNTRKNYKWSGIGLLDQLRYNKKKMFSYRAGVDLFWKGDHMQISYFLISIKVTRPSYFVRVPSYFETLWYPLVYFDPKSNI